MLPALSQRLYKEIDHTYPAVTPEEIKDFLMNSRLWPEDNLERSLKIWAS